MKKNFYWVALGLGLAACTTDKDLEPGAVAPCAGPSASAAGRVVVQFREQLGPAGPAPALLSRDEVQHSCGNYTLEQQSTVAANQLTLNFIGAVAPTSCLTTLGPATNKLDLSNLAPGRYTLALQAGGRHTTGVLNLLADRVELSTCDSNTVAVRHPVTFRIPAATVWGSAIARTPAAQQAVAGVLDSLRLAGAQPLALPPGYYSYFQTDANGQLIVTLGPLSGQPASAIATPILLSYSGSFARLKGIVRRRAQAADLSLYLTSARGETAF